MDVLVLIIMVIWHLIPICHFSFSEKNLSKINFFLTVCDADIIILILIIEMFEQKKDMNMVIDTFNKSRCY